MEDRRPAIERVVAWFARRPDVRAVALVGSQARGDARPDSDIDLVVLCHDPRVYSEDDAWPAQLGAELIRTRRWGDLVERRLRVEGVEPELDVGFVEPEWDPPPELREDAVWLMGRHRDDSGMP